MKWKLKTFEIMSNIFDESFFHEGSFDETQDKINQKQDNWKAVNGKKVQRKTNEKRRKTESSYSGYSHCIHFEAEWESLSVE